MKPFLLFLAFLFVFGCQEVQYPEKPENLIGKEKMVDILTETYLGNAARSIDNKAIMEKGIKLDSLIYRRFGVDSLQFAKSNAYYAADVNTYMEIIKEVETRLDTMQQRLNTIWEAERKKQLNAEEPKKTQTQTDSLI